MQIFLEIWTTGTALLLENPEGEHELRRTEPLMGAVSGPPTEHAVPLIEIS